ncbi:alpha-amylase family glycosyl hydrolase [Spirochaeta africana]|uniref:alpha-amylase n=1 Tax=Spirochaeta africana (strain ATCC 700263 / DSM 8902 / Z-7692) TaxID=889378 RepID=H9UFH1_SPIAZ|nr:alpha-amylase family glycosyl hydrolase [Spirochaeta africana]AFG36264.1 glycosidase [Spirochaeta africana DSM 8902]
MHTENQQYPRRRLQLLASFFAAAVVLVVAATLSGCATTLPPEEVDWSDWEITEYTPSPDDWRDHVIYFLLIDRFADGDSSNNDLGFGEYDPDNIEYFHGGDIRGMTERLNYLEALGVGAIWHTPQIQNQWLSPDYNGQRFAGYHGYWAHDFFAVDPHFGSMHEYRVFVREAHRRGMYVIQDIVPNHMGDYYSEDGEDLYQDGIPDTPAAPFDGRENASEYFHFSGEDIYSVGFAGLLNALNTDNPYVTGQLIEIFKYWIRETDIDGYRIDTVKYLPMRFWEEFVPAIREYAAELGKENFLVFGEAYEYDDVVNLRLTEADRSIGRYTGSEEQPLFNSMLDFSVTGAMTSVFAGKNLAGSVHRAPNYGSFELLNERFSDEVMQLYSPESRMQRVTFLDNHDMPRFLHRSKLDRDEDRLMLALTALYTLPGIPQLYYGTEQGFHQPEVAFNGRTRGNNRQDLWDSGYRIDGRLFQEIARLAEIRREHPALRYGQFVPHKTDARDGDVWVYSREYQGNRVLVVINRGETWHQLDPGAWLPDGGLELWTGREIPASAAEPARQLEIGPLESLIILPQTGN